MPLALSGISLLRPVVPDVDVRNTVAPSKRTPSLPVRAMSSTIPSMSEYSVTGTARRYDS